MSKKKCGEPNEEIWRDVPGYEGDYQISNLGRVKSLKSSGKILSPWEGSLHLRNPEGKPKKFSVNFLVEQTFGSSVIDLEGEVWKDISGYEGLYQASNKGRIKSISSGGKRFKKEKILVPYLRERSNLKNRQNLQTHYQVRLSKNGEGKNYNVHHLIAETFIGPRPKGYHVRHGLGGPYDNSIENLSYGTRQDNENDKFEHRKVFRKKKLKKLSVEDVEKIVKEYQDGGHTYNSLGEKFNVSPHTIGSIIRGESWSKITGIRQEETHE